MPAHLRSIVEGCSAPGCESAARVMLFNSSNAPIQPFCNKCGKLALNRVLDADNKHNMREETQES